MHQAGMTQVELSQMTGVAQGRISEYVTGKREPSETMLSFLLHGTGHSLRKTVSAEPVSLNRSDHRSWMLHCRIASHLDQKTFQNWVPTIERNLDNLARNSRGEPHTGNIAYWRDLIHAQDLRAIREALLDPTERGQQMRDVSPFAGVLTDTERQEVLSQWRTP
jgi:transcriptional regulator with XRE-family HTH domain